MSLNALNSTPDEMLESRVLEALGRVVLGPDGPNVLAAGHVYDVAVTRGVVRVLLEPERIPADAQDILAESIGPLVEALPGVERVVIKPRPRSVARHSSLPGIRRVLGVHSGKGGVGKSTVAANLAVVLAGRGRRVGLLDADVYGPSCPTLFGVRGRAQEDKTGNFVLPMERYGVKLMSLGFLMPQGQALIWRAGLVDQGLPALFSDVKWGELDLLLVDLPPGTADVHLAVARQAALTGVLTVSAPGQLSVDDVRRGMEMFADLAVPCLGLVENMAGIRCRRCGHTQALFGADGVEALAEETGVPLLARIPFEPGVAVSGDQGEPFMVSQEECAATRAMSELVVAVERALDRRGRAEAGT